MTQHAIFVDSPAMSVWLVSVYLLNYSLVDNAYHGAAIVADAFVPPWSHFYTQTHGNDIDLTTARRLLDAAGWHSGTDGIRRKNGVPLAFALTTIAGQTVILNAAVALQASWHALGANVELRPVQSTVLFEAGGILQTGNFSLAFINYGELPRPDMADNVAGTAMPPRGSNYSRFSDADVDRWLGESRATDDTNARRAIVAKISLRLRDRAPLIPVLWERFLYAWSGDLQNVRPETVNSDFWNIADWRWRP